METKLIEKGTEVFIIVNKSSDGKIIKQLFIDDVYTKEGETQLKQYQEPVMLKGVIRQRAYRYFQDEESESYYEITYRLEGKDLFSGENAFIFTDEEVANEALEKLKVDIQIAELADLKEKKKRMEDFLIELGKNIKDLEWKAAVEEGRGNFPVSEGYTNDPDLCDKCGSADTGRNSSGELQCNNCGWSETE